VSLLFAVTLCPFCGAELTVEKNAEAAICNDCGKPFVAAPAIEAFFNRPNVTTTSDNDPDMFPHFYNIHIRRKENKLVARAIDYLFALDGEAVTLKNGGEFTISTNCRRIEVPVLKTNYNDLHVEGTLIGFPDGNDIQLEFKAKLGKTEIAEILYKSNPSIHFVKN
jgi:hypothetical protein